jgi:cytidine deaminase
MLLSLEGDMKEIKKLLLLAKKNKKFAKPERSGTNVCCIVTDGENIYYGVNIETLWQTSIHAEVSAIANAISNGCGKIKMIVISADASKFTPCGACLDVLIWASEKDCILICENKYNEISKYNLRDLYKEYPIQ